MSVKSFLIQKFLTGKLPNWTYRILGRKLAAKLGWDKKENNDMAEEVTDTKSKWKSRTVWIAIVGVVLGAVTPISTALGYPIVVPDWVLQILIAMGLYTARTATTDIK